MSKPFAVITTTNTEAPGRLPLYGAEAVTAEHAQWCIRHMQRMNHRIEITAECDTREEAEAEEARIQAEFDRRRREAGEDRRAYVRDHGPKLTFAEERHMRALGHLPKLYRIGAQTKRSPDGRQSEVIPSSQ